MANPAARPAIPALMLSAKAEGKVTDTQKKLGACMSMSCDHWRAASLPSAMRWI